MFLAIDGSSAVRHLDNEQCPILAGVYADVFAQGHMLIGTCDQQAPGSFCSFPERGLCGMGLGMGRERC